MISKPELELIAAKNESEKLAQEEKDKLQKSASLEKKELLLNNEAINRELIALHDKLKLLQDELVEKNNAVRGIEQWKNDAKQKDEEMAKLKTELEKQKGELAKTQSELNSVKEKIPVGITEILISQRPVNVLPPGTKASLSFISFPFGIKKEEIDPKEKENNFGLKYDPTQGTLRNEGSKPANFWLGAVLKIINEDRNNETYYHLAKTVKIEGPQKFPLQLHKLFKIEEKEWPKNASVAFGGNAIIMVNNMEYLLSGSFEKSGKYPTALEYVGKDGKPKIQMEIKDGKITLNSDGTELKDAQATWLELVPADRVVELPSQPVILRIQAQH